MWASNHLDLYLKVEMLAFKILFLFWANLDIILSEMIKAEQWAT